MTPSAPEPKSGNQAESTSAREPAAPSAGEAGAGRQPPAVSISDHELLRCVGRGAYGSVWLARNVMGTFRAVKVVHRENFARERPFAREYEGVLKFEPISRSHPNLMQILHVGRRAEYFYYVTELADDARERPNAECRTPMEGGGRETGTGMAQSTSDVSLSVPGSSPALIASYAPRTLQSDLERRGRLPARECLSLATALALALEHLHDHGLVHRDVKPSNVIFVHGVPKLADVGLVAAQGDSYSIVGTEGYLPPEGPGTPQADLYALGILLYEASTGMNRRDYPRLPPNLRDLPDAADLLEFNEVLLRACARDSNQRYRRADELLADLALLERGASVKRLRRLERHHAVIKEVGAGMLVAGMLISGAWWQSWRAHRTARRHLAQLHLKEGIQCMAQGDYAAALPWLVAALELDPGDALRERVARVRLARVLERCPLPVGHFETPASRILAADLNSDGTVVATAHEDGGVRLWDTRSGDCLRQLHHDFPVVFCQFLPSGDRLLTVTLGQKAHVWDLAGTGNDPLTFNQMVGYGADGYTVGLNESLDPPGRAYLSKGRHRFVQIHPLTDSFEFEHLTLGLKLAGQGDTLAVRHQVQRAAVDSEVLYEGEFHDSPGAEPFARGRDDPSAPLWGRVFVLLENTSVGDLPGESGQAIFDNLRVRRYYSGQPPTPWRTLDDFSDRRLTNWIHAAPVGSRSTCRAVNGQLLLACENLPRSHLGWRGVLWNELFEVSQGHTLEVEVDLVSARAPHRQVGLGLYRPSLGPLAGPNPSGLLQGRFLLLFWWDGTIRLWDFDAGKFATLQQEGNTIPVKLQLGSLTFHLEVSPDAKYLAHVPGGGRPASLWDLERGRELNCGGVAQPRTTDARFSPDGRFLAVSHAAGLELFAAADWELVRSLSSGESFDQICFSPTGYRLAAVRNANEILVWDLDHPAESPAAFAHDLNIQRIAFSPEGRYLASSVADGRTWVWDVVRRAPFGAPLPGTLGRFSADGCHLLCFADTRGEHGVWLWDLSRVPDNTLAVPPLSHGQESTASSDQTMTAQIDGQGISLKTAAGQYSLAAPERAPLYRVGFCSNSQNLIAESTTQHAWIWDLPTRTLVGPPRPLRYDAALADHALPDLTTERRERKTLSDLAALLAGQRPDGMGGMTPVGAAERARLLGKLRRAYPKEFNALNPNRAGWHREQAEAAERAMDWGSAEFHWKRVAQAESEIDPPASAVSATSRLAYARRAADAVRRTVREGKSRWSVPLPRPPWTTSAMLDLGPYYTPSPEERLVVGLLGTVLGELAGGVSLPGRVGFDVRGLLQLNPANPVTIPVGRACQRIHFLQASSPMAAGAATRERAGRYQAAYANGERVEVLLWNPEDVPPYSHSDFFQVNPTHWKGTSPELDCTLVWSGCSAEAARRLEPLFLTRMTWELPERHRGKVIQTLTLQAESPGSAPLVFAITVE